MGKLSKNYAFIDSQNLTLSIRELGWKINWCKFRTYLKEKYSVEKAFMFIGQIKSQRKMYQSLRSAGFELIFKKVIKSKEKIKGNVDAEMVLWAVHYLYDYEKAIIVSGDGDFRCLVDYLHERNKLLNIGLPSSHSYSSLLKKFYPKHTFFVSDLKEKIEYHTKKE